MIGNEKSNEARPSFGAWEAYKAVMGGLLAAHEQNMKLAGRLAGESMRLYADLLSAPVSVPAGVPRHAGKTPEDLPVQDYDRLTVEEVTGSLKELSAAEVEQLKTHEAKNKNRAVLIERFDRSLV